MTVGIGGGTRRADHLGGDMGKPKPVEIISTIRRTIRIIREQGRDPSELLDHVLDVAEEFIQRRVPSGAEEIAEEAIARYAAEPD